MLKSKLFGALKNAFQLRFQNPFWKQFNFAVEVCPPGSSGTVPNCTCIDGYFGTFPNCSCTEDETAYFGMHYTLLVLQDI